MIAHAVSTPTVFLAVLLIGTLICIFCLNKLRSSAEQTFQKELNCQKWRADVCSLLLDLIAESQRPGSTSMSELLKAYDDRSAQNKGHAGFVINYLLESRVRHQVRAREAKGRLWELAHALRALAGNSGDESAHRHTVARIQCELGTQDHSIIVAASTAYGNMKKHLYEGGWALESIGITEKMLRETFESIVRHTLELHRQQDLHLRAEHTRLQQDVASLQTLSSLPLVGLLQSETRPDAQEPAVSVSAETATI